MKITPWQLIALIAVVVAGAQLPMFALASSIDNDEAAKSTLGILVSAVIGGSFTTALYFLQRTRKRDPE